MGEQSQWFLYRLLSLACGIATVWLIGAVASDHGNHARLFAMGLAAISLPLILYSGEARGYAPLLCFTLLAYLNSPERSTSPSAMQIAMFWIASLLAILSHLTFSFVLAGIGLSWLITQLRDRTPVVDIFKQGTRIFAVPVTVCLIVLIQIYSHVRPETGGQNNPLDVSIQLALASLGIATTGLTKWVAGITAMTLFVMGALLARRKMIGLFLIVIFVPSVTFGVIDSPYVFSRYFLVLVPFFLVAVGISLQELWAKRGAFRILAIGVIAIAVIGGSMRLIPMYQYGKGDYPLAISGIFDLAGGTSFTVGSDHDFRNRLILDFYTRSRVDAKQMTYIKQDSLLETPPDFFITHWFDKSKTAAQHIALGEATIYEIVGEYRYAGYSGWNWAVYRKL